VKPELFCTIEPAKIQSPLGQGGEKDLRFGNAQDIPRGADLGGESIRDVPTGIYTYKDRSK
jgi:hypothetical protein